MPEDQTPPSATSLPALQTASRPVRYQRISDFIREAYGPNRKRLRIDKVDLQALRMAPRLDPAQTAELLTLASVDRTLVRTRELLLLLGERLTGHPVSGPVRTFVLEVLRRHPAFAEVELAGVLENLPDAPSDEEVVRNFARQPLAALMWSEGVPPPKKGETEQIRVNAFQCLLLLLREARGTSIERIQLHLQAEVWAPAAARVKTDAQKMKALLLAKDSVALGVASAEMDRKVRDKTQEALAARAAEARASVQVASLQARMEELETKFEAEKVKVKDLIDGQEQERNAHQNVVAHLRDEYEQLRGSVLRRLRSEISLLDEGLEALRRQPPKVHVMEDHAERAIEGLKIEIQRIKGATE